MLGSLEYIGNVIGAFLGIESSIKICFEKYFHFFKNCF